MSEKALQVQPETSVQPTTPMEMIAIAVERGHDPDKLEKLMDLQERWEANNARKSYALAMTECQKAMPGIAKTKLNRQTSSNYADMADINALIIPVYTEHGFSLSFGTDDSKINDHIRVVCDVTHEDGHSKNYHVDLPIDMTGIKGSANKTKMHGTASTLTYGQRYLTTLIFNLKLKGDDGDGNDASIKKINDEQAATLKEYLDVMDDKVRGRSTGWIKSVFGAASLKSIAAKDYKEVHAGLKKRAESQ